MATKKLKLDFTNINPNLEKFDHLDVIYLSRKNIDYTSGYWININVEEGVNLLKKLVERQSIGTILVLMQKDIVVRELFQSLPKRDIIDSLKKCLIIDYENYNTLLAGNRFKVK